MRARLITFAGALVAVVLLSTWIVAAQHRGVPPDGDYAPRRTPVWRLTGSDAEQRRTAMLRRAEVRLRPADLALLDRGPSSLPTLASEMPACRFLNDAPSGTTAKFTCVLNGGAVIKVKYGRNPEIQGEVAGTRLLQTLGFPADAVMVVPRLRCYGCPREPFLTVVAGSWTFTRDLLGPGGFDDGYTEFEWVSIERKFPAPAVETGAHEGWAWWELEQSSAARQDLDALRLLAVFLAHWDNKAENQRLVCLDGIPEDASECERPLAMIQDLGATFGPTKVNLARWSSLPVWQDRATCLVSMRALPWGGGTFPDARISEAARVWLGDRLRALNDGELRALFQQARFPEFYSSTPDERDLAAWVRAFKARVDEIAHGGPCPAR